MSSRARMHRALAASVVAALASAISLAGVVAASAEDPPGNNGTVTVAGQDADTGNDSHVGCTFTVDFSGYDEGDLYADLTLETQAPTEGGTVWIDRVFIGEDPAGGATDLDASATVDLGGAFSGSPQAEQGFHVKLTVDADGSIGADTKHKTLWVDCSGEGGET